MADSETVHVVTSILTVVLVPIVQAIRGTKYDPQLRKRLEWLTAAVKRLALRAGTTLDPEPLDLDEVAARVPPPPRRGL